ncbi:MAG: hypothetical protein JRI36_13860, partial [Deltaproteobacteria bacterium]|nr:hypothetical protein [Deltaproteobacteria bacterium]
MKIAVLCLSGYENFLRDITPFLEDQYTCRTCYEDDFKNMVRLAGWADTVWLEWCNELAVYMTTKCKALSGKKVVCRLHSYEVFSGFIGEIDWTAIDHLIFVAEHVRDVFFEQLDLLGIDVPELHTYIIPNGIDVSGFTCKERRKGKNLAFLANLSAKKGPMLLIHAFSELMKVDNDF